MKDWIKRHPRESVITAIVLAGHLIFLFTNFKTSHAPPIPKQSIVVHTHVQPKPKAKAVPRPSPKPKSAPVKKKSPPPVKKKGQNVIKELQEALAKIEQKQETSQQVAPLTLPKQIQELHIDEESAGDASYLSLLVQTLCEKLELPEDGRVRVQMTVLKSGRVEKVRVLYAESENNRCYLERELVHLTLPPFSDELTGKLQHTFTLNFCHEK